MAVLSIFLCSIVESFEAIAQNLVNQENFTRIEVVGDDVTLVGERVGGLLALYPGRSFLLQTAWARG